MSPSVPAVVQAFAIMRTMADGRALSLSEVAQACAISPSSCLGLLRTLVGEGVLGTAPRKRYVLMGQWSGAVATLRDDNGRLLAIARPRLTALARRWNAPIGLWRVVARDRLELAALGEDVASLRIHMEEGQRQPVGAGAVGRALAGAQGLGAAERARRFAAVRWHRPVAQAEYDRQIDAAAACGYAIDDELSHAGILSVAVAVPGGAPPFCLSASLFAGSRPAADIAAIAADLRTLANALAEGSGIAHEEAAA